MNMMQNVPAAVRSTAFGPAAREAFASVYPHGACVMRHDLAGHPLLTLDNLARAALRLPPDCVLHKPASAPLGGVRSRAEQPLDIAAAIASLAVADLWIGFKALEQLPEYEQLLSETVAELGDLIAPLTGPARQLKAFLFLSSPGARFPFHFDPEYNLLLQVAGRKRFTLFPPEPPFLTPQQHERFHRHGRNALEWDEAFAPHGRTFTLDPGDALHHAFKAPHSVEVEAEPSISLSLTWATRASLEQNDAWALNAWLRERGFDPTPPAPLPAGRSRLRAGAWRAIRRLGLAG